METRKQTINKAWELVKDFNIKSIRKKDIIPLESGQTGENFDYILITTPSWKFDYKFNRTQFGWSYKMVSRDTYPKY